jgi:hypothetical protein
MYNPAFFERLCPVLTEFLPEFDNRDFIFRIFNNAWPDMDLRERVRHLSKTMHHFLPKEFPEAADRIVAISKRLKKERSGDGFENIFLADYIQTFGRKHPDVARLALDEIRNDIGARFAIERLLIGDQV